MRCHVFVPVLKNVYSGVFWFECGWEEAGGILRFLSAMCHVLLSVLFQWMSL